MTAAPAATTAGVYSVDALLNSMRSGRKYSFVPFYRSTDGDAVDNGCFSQWHKSAIRVFGKVFNCAEQAMMYKKAMMFGSEHVAQMVMESTSPRSMRYLGRQVPGYDDARWCSVCVGIVLEINRAKFSQNDRLRAHLLSFPRDAIFVEASPSDARWGVGLDERSQLIHMPQYWRGQNLLGFIITAVRDELI